jgi:hypothetical protein
MCGRELLAQCMQSEDAKNRIVVDGVERSRFNSLGAIIDPTEEGLFKFWRWFKNSGAVDKDGRPLVVFHGTNAMAYSGDKRIEVFNTNSRGGAFFSNSEKIAQEYGEAVYVAYLKLENPLIVYANGDGWSSISTSARIEAAVTERVRAQKERIHSEVEALFAELFDENEAEPYRDPDSSTGPIILKELSNLPGLDDGAVETDTIAKAARRLGYDGVIIRDVVDSPTSDAFYSKTLSDILVATEPENIKSIEDYGCWELDDTRFTSASAEDEMPSFGR